MVSLSPTISNLEVSGNTISKSDGGILKLSCAWTNSELVSSATAYLGFVEDLNSPTLGPQGIISSGTIATSTTSTATTAILRPVLTVPLILRATATSTSTTTATSTATSTATATSTTTATSTATTTEDPPWLFSSEYANPLSIPTGIATRDLSGTWSVEIPFPASSVASASAGIQQMQLWMVINEKKTNTLAFEITISE